MYRVKCGCTQGAELEQKSEETLFAVAPKAQSPNETASPRFLRLRPRRRAKTYYAFFASLIGAGCLRISTTSAVATKIVE